MFGVKDMISTAIVDTLVPREGMISRCSFKIKLEDRRGTTKTKSEMNFYSRRSERERKTRSNSTTTTITTM